MIELLKNVFGAKELRRYDNNDGSVMHAEVMIDDSVVMLAEASVEFPANQHMLHVYVKDVDAVFKKAVAQGCTVTEQIKQRQGDPDRRGAFEDFAGNTWAVGTQMGEGDKK